MSKLIIYKWNAYSEKILIDNLRKLGHEIIEFSYVFSNPTRDYNLAHALINKINEVNAEGVVTLNYFPIISMVCDTCKIPYFSWIFNSPHLSLYAKSITLQCNHIAMFDRSQVELLKGSGCETVFHLPLAVDTNYYDGVISESSDWENNIGNCGYSDVSFIGSLYTDKEKRNVYDELRDGIIGRENVTEDEKETWNRIDDIIENQKFCYNKNYIQDIEESDYYYLLNLLKNKNLLLEEDYYDFNDQVIFNSILAKKVTIKERMELLSNVADFCKDKYDFKLYTGSDVSELDSLKWCNNGRVDYEHEMPLVFNRSKINVNITLRSIGTGIPLRALDILACGGFLLSDPQEELLEYFEENKEVVVYRSAEECLNKIEYYLKHEDERTAIAKAGKKAVKERFSYEKLLPLLLNNM